MVIKRYSALGLCPAVEYFSMPKYMSQKQEVSERGGLDELRRIFQLEAGSRAALF